MNNWVLNDLFDYPNMKIYQIKGNFKFSLDSILLAEFVKINRNVKNILDLCTGNAPVPLIISTKCNVHIDAFEIQQEIYELAKASIEYNNKNSQISVYNIDAREYKNVQKIKKYDIITCNPPYFKLDNTDFINENDKLSIARHEITFHLEDVFKISSDLLDDKGELYLVHRAARIDEIIILANQYKLNVKNIQFIKTKKENKPYIVLVRCVKNSKYGVKVNNVINIDNLISYQGIFKEEL